MSEPREEQVIQKFRGLLARGEFPENIRVVYRVAGGMPSERVEEEFELLGSKQVKVRRRSMLDTAIPEEASTELEQAEVLELLQQLGTGLDGLVTRSEARFLPDSLVGTITIEVEGEEATLYFLADEEDRLAQEKPIAPELSQTIQRISTVSQRLLQKDEDNNG